MVTRKCVQCGHEFNLSDSETEFYKSKNLSLPKRCAVCRNYNKKSGHISDNGINKKLDTNSKKHNYSQYTVKKKKENTDVFAVFFIVVAAFFTFISYKLNMRIGAGVVIFDLVMILVSVLFEILNKKEILIKEFDTGKYKYTFYNVESMVQHYIKHYEDVSCDSMEDYLMDANYAIISSNKQKPQKDGDTAYYNTKTKDFVVVAKAGYIRTFFKADLDYYNRQ